ncbi:MAG TPA: tRNA-dihydrouridine synthase [Candidatus Saccharimonadales bacterium]|nr:tRNA-dihydrouridine synthase [Candidatus Saccharimonadales bacterium]
MLPKPFFVLAPMDDVTDTVFRQVVANCAPPDLYFTEFVNVDGLASPGRSKLLKKLQFTPEEQPLIAQIWGKDPDNFYKIAIQIADGSMAEELGLPNGINFAGVDINMGCPEKNVIKHGTCAALINDRPLAQEIIDATKKGLNGKLPLSIKTRTGFNQPDMSWIEFLLKQNLWALTIHGRTRQQKSKVPADWDFIGQARLLRNKISPTTLIIGNGDVRDRAHGLDLAKKHKLDGIMIGRGVFHDPFAFAEKSPWPEYNRGQRIDLYKKHVELFATTWQNHERPMHTLNKFCKIYINNFDGAKEFRDHLMKTTSTEELLEQLNNFKLLVDTP